MMAHSMVGVVNGYEPGGSASWPLGRKRREDVVRAA